MHQAHSLATAAGRGFQHHRIANALGDLFAFFARCQAARGTGNKRHAGFFHLLPGAGLRAHHFHGVRSGPDELDAGIGAGLGERRIFREKAVAGMNRLRARTLGHVENLVHPQIRLGGRSWTDRISFVGFADMERSAVNVGIDSDGGDAHLAAGAYDAHRDLSPVGDQNLLEHSWSDTSIQAQRDAVDFTCTSGDVRDPNQPACVINDV